MNVHEVLVKARNLIAEEEDWVREQLRGEDGGYCLRGAVIEASAGSKAWSEPPVGRDAEHVLADVLSVRADLAWCDRCAVLVRFNNAPTVAHAEVLAAFDRAILATAPEPDVSWLPDGERSRELVAAEGGVR